VRTNGEFGDVANGTARGQIPVLGRRGTREKVRARREEVRGKRFEE
jgi:hypothetical protein